jgi:hypothetical protein
MGGSHQSNDQNRRANWEEGARSFNEGRYWDAHEAWERGWTRLPPDDRAYVQALIQVAAVLLHLERGRPDPARRLARAALDKFAATREVQARVPRLEIPGAEEFLEQVLVTVVSEQGQAGKSLQARVRWP